MCKLLHIRCDFVVFAIVVIENTHEVIREETHIFGKAEGQVAEGVLVSVYDCVSQLVDGPFYVLGNSELVELSV